VKLTPPRIRLRSFTADTAGRKVTWLELFFDLVFVAAVAQVAEPLREHYTLAELTRFTPLFLLIWWAWTGRALFSTRFETDDVVQRGLTMIEMFAVAVMAANARDSLASRASAGFAAAYAGVRLILLVHYWRAAALEDARGLTAVYLTGHGLAAALWLMSAIAPLNIRLALWCIAFLVDLGTPWLTVNRTVHLPPHPSHLPERFGLFTLILLGESVVAVMKGIESQETWSAPAAITAFSGVAALFGIWWWYFEGLNVTAERSVRSRGDAIRLHVWSYGHFPLYLAIVILGVGLRRMVTHATHEPLPPEDALMWGAGLCLLVSAGAILKSSRRLPGSNPQAHHPEPPPARSRMRAAPARLTDDTARGISRS
jgi:low temperature requirement protein LtrA